jgi:hypothetical protein
LIASEALFGVWACTDPVSSAIHAFVPALGSGDVFCFGAFTPAAVAIGFGLSETFP